MQLKSPSTRQMELSGLTVNPQGKTHLVAPPSDGATDGVQLHFENKAGKLFFGDSLQWLASLETATVDLVFADPPYNLKKAD